MTAASFALGGHNGGFRLSTVEAYTPATNIWTKVANMPTARQYLAAAVTADGRIFAIGGYNGSSDLSTMEAYVP